MSLYGSGVSKDCNRRFTPSSQMVSPSTTQVWRSRPHIAKRTLLPSVCPVVAATAAVTGLCPSTTTHPSAHTAVRAANASTGVIISRDGRARAEAGRGRRGSKRTTVMPSGYRDIPNRACERLEEFGNHIAQGFSNKSSLYCSQGPDLSLDRGPYASLAQDHRFRKAY